jgi:hypothetical protein
MFAGLIANLLTVIVKVFITLVQFLIVVVLGLVAAILFALPWLLRMVSLLIWLTAAYMGFTSIQTIYAPYSPAIPVIALQFSVILILVGWVIIVLSKNTSFVWGGMAAGGLVVGGVSIGSIWLLAHWQHADLFFRVLPPALFSILLIYETLHLRSMRHKWSAVLTIPALPQGTEPVALQQK